MPFGQRRRGRTHRKGCDAVRWLISFSCGRRRIDVGDVFKWALHFGPLAALCCRCCLRVRLEGEVLDSDQDQMRSWCGRRLRSRRSRYKSASCSACARPRELPELIDDKEDRGSKGQPGHGVKHVIMIRRGRARVRGTVHKLGQRTCFAFEAEPHRAQVQRT